MGYKVTAVDCDPAEYSAVASACCVKTVRADLEKDRLDLADASVDCAVFTEVLEHLNPYYVEYTMSEVSRVLKPGGKLILTTPNIASQYTKKDVVELLERYGFMVLEARYSEVNDLTYVNPEPGEYLKLKSYLDLLKLAARKPTKLNMLRALACPLVKAVPSLIMLIVVVAKSASCIDPRKLVRW